MLHTKEHYDLMERFEAEYRGESGDREDKSLWVQGNIYQNGEVNNLFLAYRRGYALAKSLYSEAPPL